MNFLQTQLRPWFHLVLPYAATFLGLQLLTRFGLLIYSGQADEATVLQLAKIFSWGFLFDLIALTFFLLPIMIIHLCAKRTAWLNTTLRVTRLVFFVGFTYSWIFTAISEYFFWEEFGTRFNFIAVDYLVYTTEVIGNIKESYPLYPLLGAILVLSLCATFVAKKYLWLDARVTTPETGRAFAGLATLLLIPTILFFTIAPTQITVSSNQSLQELSSNGTYDLFSAYRNNELSYKKFYPMHDEATLPNRMRELLEEEENDFVNKDPDDITRLIKRPGPEKHKNVVMVVMESMSADFMGVFGNKENLTPSLDALSKQGLFFTDLYATGTRTVRGLEALTLSIPPTPGQSILRRPDNGNLFSLGFIFQDRGYDTAFIYGGYGYFDNMNAFFSENGYRILDRTEFDKGEVEFSNVWGVSDEDLYEKVISEADQAYARKQPFMYQVMTTSNHRPYTFPAGRPGIPAKGGGRSMGVKYADYAVGQFVKNVQHKPWFKDTVFIFVADHTAGAGGKIELSLKKYHIPAIFYAPGFIKPQEYKLMASQIDMAPVLLGLLNFSYYTKFFGEDLLNDGDEAENAHAFVSNYQKIAYVEDGQLTVLAPLSPATYYSGEKPMDPAKTDDQLLVDTITYYQYASGWKERMKRIPTVYKK